MVEEVDSQNVEIAVRHGILSFSEEVGVWFCFKQKA